MKVRIAQENSDAEKLIPPAQTDGSGIGINYADAYVKALAHTLDNGQKVSCKRRGLKITLVVGDKKGEGLMRRLEHGSDVRVILRRAIEEAATAAGVGFDVQEGAIFLDIPSA